MTVDIASGHAGETELEELRRALDCVRDAVVSTTGDGRITSWNRAAESIYGFARSDALGRVRDELLKTLHPHGLTSIADALGRAGSWEGEFSREDAKGNRIQIEARQTVTSGGASGLSVTEIARNITGRIGLEEDARMAAHRYRNVFQAMAASFWELDFTLVRQMVGKLIAEGVTDFATYFAEHPEFIQAALEVTMVLDVNDATVTLYEAGSREEIIGQSVASTWPLESRHVYAESLLAAFQRRPSHHAETRLLTMKGNVIDVLFTVCWPPGHEGRGSVLVGVIDISDRKRAEQELMASEMRYRSLFHALTMAQLQIETPALLARLFKLREEGVPDIRAYALSTPGFIEEMMDLSLITGVNDTAVKMLGASSQSDFIGLSVRDVFPPSGYQTFLRCLEVGFNRGGPFREETRVCRLDGSEVDVLFSFSPSEALRSQGLVLIGMIDISERITAQNALLEMQTQFAHAARLSVLGELTASIAHEINQPLAAISAYGTAGARLLTRETPDLAKIRTIQENIAADAMRAADIVRRIRGMATKSEPDRAPMSLNAAIEEAMVFLKFELMDNDVTPQVSLCKTGDGVLADRVQIQQVVVNLAMNAIQQMKRHAGDRRALSIVTQAGEGAFVRMIVEDTGGGIAEENLARLFESFFTTKDTGLGIGLSICRSIVEGHGGRIWAENVASGARFCFELPAE